MRSRAAVTLFRSVLLGTVLSFSAPHANATGQETYRQLGIFGDIFEQVRKNHVTSADDAKLIENALNGMLRSLDPHSSYLGPEAYAEMTTHYQGEFGGLGIEVALENDLIKVIAPIDSTPAAKAGIQAGDVITDIDGVSVRGVGLEEAVKKMRGPVNTPVRLTITRERAKKPLEFTIVRDVVRVQDVKYRVEKDIGYIKISTFTNKTAGDVESAMRAIHAESPAKNLIGYILDLRLNPGGPLDQAVNVSDLFLERGLIVSVRGRSDEDVSRYGSTTGDLAGGKPIIVLVNGGSASAAEIVAGALQDHRRATVLGTRSFGKGSVQTVFPLREGGALRLTTALYHTPSGASIQGKGISPDIVLQQPVPEELKGSAHTGETALEGHIKGAEEDAEGSGSSAYVPPEAKDDVQLKFALALLRGEETNPAFPPDSTRTALAKQPASSDQSIQAR